MNEAIANPPTVKHRFGLALGGLILAIISPVFWLLFLDNNFLQRTALPMWIAMAIGLIVAVFAIRGDRRRRTKITAGFTVGWVAFSIVGYTIFTRIPDPGNITTVASVAELPLVDHLGESVRLADVLRDGPALVVFYRGHW